MFYCRIVMPPYRYDDTHLCECKGTTFFSIMQINFAFFAKMAKSSKGGVY